MSAWTWANTAQKCRKCCAWVYPFFQSPLEKSQSMNKSNKNKRHPQELCQKCQRLGRPCTEFEVIRRARNKQIVDDEE